jgi:hypothetical protein
MALALLGNRQDPYWRKFMRKQCTWYLVAMITGLVGCASNDDMSTSSTEQSVAGTDMLLAGERLLPNEQISAGHTTLVYQGDNNLVLYQDGNALWATFASLGAEPGAFWMQTDCNAVVYTASATAVWASNTDRQGSNCVAHVIEGDWYICSGTRRVFSARGGGDCGPGGRPVNYLACYTDAPDPNRALPAFQGIGFSFTQCVNRCGSLNFSFAGLQFGGECFCGDALRYVRVDDAECNMPCTNGGGPCGGVWRNSIYRTGIVHL